MLHLSFADLSSMLPCFLPSNIRNNWIALIIDTCPLSYARHILLRKLEFQILGLSIKISFSTSSLSPESNEPKFLLINPSCPECCMNQSPSLPSRIHILDQIDLIFKEYHQQRLRIAFQSPSYALHYFRLFTLISPHIIT